MVKKWGKIGAPHSAKRKAFLSRARRLIFRKYRGYGSRRAFLADMAKRGYAPRKKYKPRYGDYGDWRRKRPKKVMLYYK